MNIFQKTVQALLGGGKRTYRLGKVDVTLPATMAKEEKNAIENYVGCILEMEIAIADAKKANKELSGLELPPNNAPAILRERYLHIYMDAMLARERAQVAHSAFENIGANLIRGPDGKEHELIDLLFDAKERKDAAYDYARKLIDKSEDIDKEFNALMKFSMPPKPFALLK